ncbi:transglycosylase SLT domain-containing protein [Roseomonas populi]|uniref:Transglycosylase SLT domain-containing protein n=1 Tax=Roseomonas populi TaxID=3121582 RepID=A0ABT1X827_9PROT|nr:transglycosylase SLT domain-containing protein [Roseomonas pecuniae]MCR0984254.1 transglycosylase SLT domain-containing protein [Roseomonas pecuniae]
MDARRLPLALLLLAAAGCRPDPAPAPAAPPPALAAAPAPSGPSPARWDSRPNGREWSRLALAGLEAHAQPLLAFTPRDIAAYCPRYAAADRNGRAAFWVGLLSVLAGYESNYDPSVSFQESFPDAQGRPVISRGLLQISRESANGYGCEIGDDRTLHDPAVNLSCAARIVNRLVTRDGMIASDSSPWKGMAAYWSPFRRADRKAEMAQWTAAQPYCR